MYYILTLALALAPWLAQAQVCFDGNDCTGAPAISNPPPSNAPMVISLTNITDLLNTKLTIPSGNSNQCVLGNGTVGTCPGAIQSTAMPARSLALSTSSTGFLLSATRNAFACYSGTTKTTSSIGGPASVSIYFETAATNSTTPSDWTIIGEQTNAQDVTLAIALQSVDTEPWSLCRVVTPGKYTRLRYQANTGTVSATISPYVQEVLY